MENEFRINKLMQKKRYNFTVKEINAIKTQLVVTIETNLLQHWMPRNLKLSQVPKSHTL